MDLFYAPEIENGPSTLHEKIKILLKKSKTLKKSNYFKNSKHMTCGKRGGSSEPIISIASFSFIFGPGQSYVQSLLSKKGIGAAEIGDTWGPPLFLELGGQRYNTPNSNIPITSNLYKQGGAQPADYSKFFTPNAYSNRLTVKIGGKTYPVCFGNIRISGSGQTASVIRGSCVLVLYDVKDFGPACCGGDAWPDRTLTPAVATGRIQCSGFFWAGHFGISTDYNMLLPQSYGPASYSPASSNPTDYQPTTLKIGTSPTNLLGPAAPSLCKPENEKGKQHCLPLYVPRYTTRGPHTKQTGQCPYQNSRKRCSYQNAGRTPPPSSPAPPPSITCGGVSNDPLFNKSIEFLCIDIWIELQPMQTGECSGGANCSLLGYPLFFVNMVCGKRFFLSNCNFFSYQIMNIECTGLVYLGNSFTRIVSLFGAPTDTFIQQCSFAAKTMPTSPNVLSPAAISLLVENGDKVSIVNSTFHGQCHANCNKLAMFNCYCLSVGRPRSIPKGAGNGDDRMVEPGVMYSFPKNAKFMSGWGGLPSSSRLIFQNMIFVVHVNGDEMRKLPTSSAPSAPSSTSPPSSSPSSAPSSRWPPHNSPIRTLNDLKTYGYFDVDKMNPYSYLASDPNKNVFPFWIDTTGKSLESAISVASVQITNVFLKDVTYYGIFIYSKPKHNPPIFSAINLTNIQTAFVNNFTKHLGNIL